MAKPDDVDGETLGDEQRRMLRYNAASPEP